MPNTDSNRKLILSRHYAERLDFLEKNPQASCESIRILPRSKIGHIGAITQVEDLAGARAMLNFREAGQCQLRGAGLRISLQPAGGLSQESRRSRIMVA